MSDLRDEVIARVDLLALASQYVTVIQTGNTFKARCPFHAEKTASLNLNPEKGLWHCFGCKAGGTVIDFAMRAESLEFRDALEWLARRFGIEISAGEKRPRTGRERMNLIMAGADKFYRMQLASPAAERARQYLADRKIGTELAAAAGLGYALPEWQGITDMMLEKGVLARELIDLGLIRKRDQGSGYYDLFRHRIMFPLRSAIGVTVGFAGRALSDEDKPKYLNSPATPLFDKSKYLYNLDRAKRVLGDDGVIIVEGHMDALSLVGVGVANVVATCGTSLTAEHVQMLMRYTDYFYICYDGDSAGLAAAWKASVLVMLAGFSPRIVQLPDGQDPDDFVKSAEDAPASFAQLVKNARPAAAWWLKRQMDSQPDAEPQRVRRWIVELGKIYTRLPDALIKRQICDEVCRAIKLNPQEVRGLLDSRPDPPAGGYRQQHGADRQGRNDWVANGGRRLENEVMRRILSDPAFAFSFCALAELEHSADWWQDQRLRDLFAAILASSVDEVMHTEQWSNCCAEIIALSAINEDGESLIRKQMDLYYRRLIEDEEHAWQSREIDPEDRYGLDGVKEHLAKIDELRAKISKS